MNPLLLDSLWPMSAPGQQFDAYALRPRDFNTTLHEQFTQGVPNRGFKLISSASFLKEFPIQTCHTAFSLTLSPIVMPFSIAACCAVWSCVRAPLRSSVTPTDGQARAAGQSRAVWGRVPTHACCSGTMCPTDAKARARGTAMQKLRIVTVGISDGRSLTRPFRDARSFLSPRLWPVLTWTRTPRKFGVCPSFKDHFLPPRAKPPRCDSPLSIAVGARRGAGTAPRS